MVKMLVSCTEKQVMLNDEGRYPEIVGRDRGPLAAELQKQARIVMARLLVRAKDLDAIGV